MVNSKAYTKLFLLVLPVVAVLVIWVIHSQIGGLAPAPPMAIPPHDAALVVPRPKQQQATVLAPHGSDFDVPPGGSLLPSSDESEMNVELESLRIATPVPILELNPPANRR